MLKETPHPGWYLREWIKERGLNQEKFRERIGISKGRLSDLVTGKERWNKDHLHLFASHLDIEPWELIHKNPEKPAPADITSIENTIKRIPDDDRERALRAAAGVLETFATPPLPPAKPAQKATPKRKRA